MHLEGGDYSDQFGSDPIEDDDAFKKADADHEDSLDYLME